MPTEHQKRIVEFMRKAGQEVPGKGVDVFDGNVSWKECDRIHISSQPNYGLKIPSYEVRKLRALLILEEAEETIEALGFDVADHIGFSDVVDYEECSFGYLRYYGDDIDMKKVIDGCADLSVVAIGTLAALGVDDEPVLKEVDEANLRKFGPGSYRREDGKWMKPPDFVPPDVLAAAARGGEL